MTDYSALIERLEERVAYDKRHFTVDPLHAEAAAALRDQQSAIHAIEHAAIMLMGEVGNAFYEGFRDAIGKEPWEDCYDYAAVKGRDYARDKVFPYVEALQPGKQADMVLVPRVPTDAMLQGACRSHTPNQSMGFVRGHEYGECPSFEKRRRIWADMVSTYLPLPSAPNQAKEAGE